MNLARIALLSLLSAALAMVGPAVNTTRAATLSTDFLAAEAANDDDGSFGPWTIGGYDTTNATFGTFTAYTSAQHLDNWGSLLPNNGGNGPFSGNEFKGYGYDTSLAVPAVVINTSNSSLSPCCGISSYAPGQIFLHSWFGNDPDPARHSQVIRYTSPGVGTLDVSALFTQMHSGPIPFSVILDGVTLDTNTLVAQNQTAAYSNLSLAVNAGSILDFALAGGASAAFDATVNFTPVPEPSSVLLLGMGLVGVAAYARRRKAA